MAGLVNLSLLEPAQLSPDAVGHQVHAGVHVVAGKAAIGASKRGKDNKSAGNSRGHRSAWDGTGTHIPGILYRLSLPTPQY